MNFKGHVRNHESFCLIDISKLMMKTFYLLLCSQSQFTRTRWKCIMKCAEEIVIQRPTPQLIRLLWEPPPMCDINILLLAFTSHSYQTNARDINLIIFNVLLNKIHQTKSFFNNTKCRGNSYQLSITLHNQRKVWGPSFLIIIKQNSTYNLRP